MRKKESKIVKILPTTYITLMTLKNENKNGTVPITCGMTGTFTLYK